MSYTYLSQAEQDEMYDLKVIVNHLTCGLLDIVVLSSIHFSVDNDPYSVHWFIERIHQLRAKNTKLMKEDSIPYKLGL